jgi:hypothetical protein
MRVLSFCIAFEEGLVRLKITHCVLKRIAILVNAIFLLLFLSTCLVKTVEAQVNQVNADQNRAGQNGADQNGFSRKNTFGIFTAYSNDSSHILLGDAENRKLLDIGVVYNRRLFQNHFMNWQYSGELLPVALESDPIAHQVQYQTRPTVTTIGDPYTWGPVISCSNPLVPYTYVYEGVTYVGNTTLKCTAREWTIGEGMSPVGFQWNFLPQRKTQFFVDGHGGYMYSTQPIPMTDAGSFNFTFDLGAGLEFYRNRKHSLRAEVRFHHISNHNTSDDNPGIDNVLFQVTYAFGK